MFMVSNAFELGEIAIRISGVLRPTTNEGKIAFIHPAYCRCGGGCLKAEIRPE